MSKQTQEDQLRQSQSWNLRSKSNGNSNIAGSAPKRGLISLRTVGLLTSGGLMLLGLFSLFGLWRTGKQFLEHLWPGFAVSEPPAKVDIRSLVVQQIRGASELTTAVYTMESVVPTSREQTFGGYVIGKTTLLYIAHGEVRAGVDLAALRPEDVQLAGKTISLRLPPPKILDSKIDVNRSRVYDYDRGFMGLGPDVAPELQELAQRQTLAKIVAAACTDGVLQAANERAKLAVSQLLTTAGYSQFTVTTQPPTDATCAASNSASPAPNAPVLPDPQMPTTPVPAAPASPLLPSPQTASPPSPPVNAPPSPAPITQPAL